MEDIEIRKNILRRLYDLYRESGSAAGLSPEELSGDIGASVDVIKKEIRTLEALGSVRDLTMFAHRITEQGVREIEVRPETQIHNKIEISGGSVGTIYQAHTINSSVQFFEQLLKEIDQLPEVGPEKKKQWKETLWEMSKHPALPSIIERLLSSIGSCPG
ncbi:MAG: hypothetical protein ABFD76_13815 [Smithella sp.]